MSRYCLTLGLFLGLVARSFSLVSAADAPAVHDPSDVPQVAPAVRQAMQDRDYSAARKAIDEAAMAKDAPHDYLAYLRAWSLDLDKQYDPAIAALDKFEKDFPQSSWLRRARFARAQAMVGKGDFRGAQAIYESEGKYLISDERRQQSAAVYLEFGDAQFQPRHTGQEPDYQAARQFYQLAIDTGLKGPRRVDVEYRMCICLEKLGLNADAAKGYEEFLAQHADDPRQNEVRYRRGECLLKAGNMAEARKAWRELLAKASPTPVSAKADAAKANSPSPATPLPKGEGKAVAADASKAKPAKAAAARDGAARDWAAEAAFHLAETWRCPQPRDEEALRRGVAALRDFLKRYPDHALAGHAHMEIAVSQINMRHFDDAIATLKDFLQDPRSKGCKELPDAQRTLGDVYAKQKKYAEALAAWREYLARYPSHEGWTAVERSIIDTEYAVGREKFEAGDYDAATRLLTEFTEHYPLDAHNPGILLLFGAIQAREKKWDAAIAAWQRLIDKYPRAEEAGQAAEMIAHTLDEKLGRYEEARDRYRKAGDSAAADAISNRRMMVETERVFRSDETPQLKLAARNVASVKLRVYKIDLETYFRKMHSVAGIERLDVSLIDPDATFDFALPDFAKYKPLATAIPIALPAGLKAGVAAVTVTSPNQEATTLLIQSDLQITVRASRDEVLVFAENMRTGKPWPGVRLLLSDGKSVFAEAKTGDDGFYAHSHRELEDTAYLRVFAAAEGGHIASTAVQLAGEASEFKLADRIFVETDRGEYRAGETVHVHGCARHAQRDRLVIETGKRLTIELHDAADHRLRRQSAAITAAGTFACDFLLPAGMPEGTYNIVASDDAGHQRSAQFAIAAPPPETARLTIDVPRTVYYRGEPIEGTFRATLPGDRPLAGAKVQFALGNQAPAAIITDARGEARFIIPTEELEESGLDTLAASIPAEELVARHAIMLAMRGFSIDLSTARPVYVEGESVDVQLKTVDAATEPIAQKLLVKVARRWKDRDSGAVRDEPIEEHTIATAADGTARLTLKAAKGGIYTVRASGADRFGNTIEHSLDFRVSDDDDPERLLLLVDHTQLKAGDMADAQIYWRGEPATAVVTTYYGRLREHRLVALKHGFNRLQLPVTAAMTPGFTLDVMVMAHSSRHAPHDVRPDGDQTNGPRSGPDTFTPMHEAVCQFSVDPQLQVKLETHRHGDAKAKPLPGEPMDVIITTCDAQGKPVAAEVSLAVMTAGRGAAELGAGDALARLLSPHGRRATFQTASSIQFHYRPMHRTIAADEPEPDDTTAAGHVMPQRGIPAGGEPAASKIEDSKDIFDQSKAAEAVNSDPFGSDAASSATVKSSKPAAAAPQAEDNPFGDPASADEKAGMSGQSKAAQRPLESGDVSRYVPPEWPGYWNPSLATGSDGRATVTITPPDAAGELTLSARAITADNRAGKSAEKLALARDLGADIHLPAAFTDGDEVEIPVVVRNNFLDRGAIDVELSMNVDGARWSEKRTLAAKGPGRLETSFRPLVRQTQRASKADEWLPVRPVAQFTLTIKAGDRTTVVRRSVPIRPYGANCQVTATGIITGDGKLSVAPSRRHWLAPTLQIAVSPTVERSLFDMLDRSADDKDRSSDAAEEAANFSTAGDLMAALALAKLYPAVSAEGRALDEKIRETLCVMIAAQQRDGGWLVRGRPTNLATNAMAHWSLVLAAQAGYDVPRDVLDAVLANLRRGLAQNQDDNPAVKALVLHALAIAGQGDFNLANQMLRDRKSLAPLGRAYLALALIGMDRKDSATELLNATDAPDNNVAASRNIEADALTALALLRLDPAAPRAKALVDALLARRTGPRWRPENATGPSVLAAAEWLAHNRPAEVRSRLTITVNGKALKTLDLDPRAATETLDVPMSLLGRGKQEIALHVAALNGAGSARVACRATLRGVEPAENMTGTSAAWHIERSYEPPLMEVDGQTIPRGFSALTGDLFDAAFSNRMTQLPANRRGFVEISVYHKITAKDVLDPSEANSAGESDPVIVEPLPSGAAVVESSLEGPFDRADILPGRIVFYFRHRAPNSTIRYELEGVRPSSNLIAPTLLLRVGGEAPLAVAKPKSLVVLPAGAKSSDPYRLSPDELLALAALARRKGDIDAAIHNYSELLETWHGHKAFGLEESAYKQTVLALMELGMGRARPAKLVEYCETVKEKWPQEPVTIEQLLTAGGAYREIGEFERSYLACRAAVEGSFTRESGIAGFLDSRGEFLRSASTMNRLLRDYPPEAYAAEAEFDLAQRIYAKASEPRTAPAPHQPLLERDHLIARAGEMLDAFLTAYPANPSADQAAFAAANAQLDLKHYAAAADWAAAAARRYPKSDLLDSYWYMLGYCDFALGQYPAAIDMCRKVADTQHLDKETGRMVESQNKFRAIYILGQIYQSLGQRADAIREYRRVQDRIPDAQSSVRYFVRKEIALPECTTLKPGAAAQVELRYRNIAACDMKVYRVDLMKFCEAGQALGDFSQVNLAGIRPLSQKTVALSGGDYADHVEKLALPLKKEGAYLVVCRGEDLYASGLFVISPLEMEERFDAATGQLRVFVKDAATGRCASEVRVRVMPRGPNVQANVAGTTDLRGVFVAGNPATGATIVAEAAPGQYAYLASPAAANENRNAVAQTQRGEVDPTTPFEAADFAPLEDLIKQTGTQKDWLDNSGEEGKLKSAARSDLTVSSQQSQRVVNRRAARTMPRAAAAAAPESPLPPLGPNAPANLGGEESVAERRIRAALQSPTSIEFVETPLKDVVDYLSDTHHIEIQLDEAGLKDAGVDESTPVTKSLKGISLRAALKLILDDLQLKYVIHNEVLLITSPTKAESDDFMVTKAYPVTDLVPPASDGAVDMQPLEDLLTNTVAQKSWLDNGGTGTISNMIVGNRALLVVSESQEVQEQVEDTLAMLRKAGGLKAGARKLAEREQTDEDADLPARHPVRLHRAAPPAMQGMGMGGMGGMGGGMGGMSGDGQGPRVISVIPVIDGGSPAGDADLLGGLKNANAANQRAKALHLKQRQDAGQGKGGGMGGGMGGMGAGMF